MNTVFKKGQVVYCALRGKGVVKYVSNDQQLNIYPVMVEFDDAEDTSYTFDGKVLTPYPRTLFFSPPEIVGDTEPPFEPTLDGKHVVVQVGQGTYIGTIKREDHQSFALVDDQGGSIIIFKSRTNKIFELSQIEF